MHFCPGKIVFIRSYPQLELIKPSKHSKVFYTSGDTGQSSSEIGCSNLHKGLCGSQWQKSHWLSQILDFNEMGECPPAGATAVSRLMKVSSLSCYKTHLWSCIQLFSSWDKFYLFSLFAVCFSTKPQDTAWLLYSILYKADP